MDKGKVKKKVFDNIKIIYFLIHYFFFIQDQIKYIILSRYEFYQDKRYLTPKLKKNNFHSLPIPSTEKIIIKMFLLVIIWLQIHLLTTVHYHLLAVHNWLVTLHHL